MKLTPEQIEQAAHVMLEANGVEATAAAVERYSGEVRMWERQNRVTLAVLQVLCPPPVPATLEVFVQSQAAAGVSLPPGDAAPAVVDVPAADAA